MKVTGKTATLLAWTVTLLCVLPARSAPMAVAQNDPAPPVVGEDLSGNLVRLDWGASELTLVNFWATWCPPCLREIPLLEELHDRHSAQGLRVVGVCKDRLSPAEIAAWLEPLGVSYTIFTDGRFISRAWGGVGVLPTSFLVDREGVVLRRYVGGAEEGTAALARDVEAYLAGEPLGPPYVPRESGDEEVVTPEVVNR